MQQTKDTRRRDHLVIPNVTCSRCHSAMRLKMLVPAQMADTAQDTLVFECVCGASEQRTFQKPQAA